MSQTGPGGAALVDCSAFVTKISDAPSVRQALKEAGGAVLFFRGKGRGESEKVIMFTLVVGSLNFGAKIVNMLKQHDKTAILLGLYMVSPTH